MPTSEVPTCDDYVDSMLQASMSPGVDLCSASSSNENKSDEAYNFRGISTESLPPASVNLPSNPSGQLISPVQQLPSPSPVFLAALVKFHTCLVMITEAVVGLFHSLKLDFPQNSDIRLGSESNPNNFNMIETPIHPIVRRLSHSKISIDNNNIKGLSGTGSDTVVNVSNASIGNSIDTDSSQASIVPSYGSSCKPKQPPSRFFPQFLLKYAGIFLALFASVCMSLVTLIVKFMDGYHPVSKVVWRLQGVLVPSFFLLLYFKYYQKKELVSCKKDETRSDSWKWKLFILLAVRGIVGASADIFQYYSLSYLPLADSTVISFSTPIFVCVVAHFMLGEKCGVVPIFTAILTLCGVIVISKPPILTGEEEMSQTVLIGNMLALACMICNTTTTVVMRYLQNVHFTVTMLALGIFGTVEGFIVTLFTAPVEIPSGNMVDWYLAALIAGLFFVGQLAMTLALQMEEAGVVSLVRTGDVLFAFIWQVNFLHQHANMYSYIGATIVTIGVCITAIRKWVADLPEHSAIRNRLYFILR